MSELYIWLCFNLFLLLMLSLDLGVFNSKNQIITFKKSIYLSLMWILLALIFNCILYYFTGSEKALDFLTGYVIEKSLSIDNIFVMILIFQYFSIPDHAQHKVLFWGVIGALLMRLAFIFLGVELMEHLHWIIYVFGGILIFTGIKMLFKKDEASDFENSLLIRLIKKLIPVSSKFHANNFFTKINGKKFATPLFLCLITVEATDLIFAIDSIPAILTVTEDKFIIYSSNAFAILGLRSLYFSMTGMVKIFTYLHYALAFILSFVGVKMLLSDYYSISTTISLMVILTSLGISILCSLIFKKELIKKKTLIY